MLEPKEKLKTKPAHTTIIYGELQRAYDFYNNHLFNGQLPQVVIVLSKKSKAKGYFIGDNWANESLDTGSISEVALNPVFLAKQPLAQTLSTLVHEMVHCWQHYQGEPPRRCYHNKQWSTKMEDLGLMPSSTGQEGGKRTGQSVTHYIIESEFTLFNKTTKLLFESGWVFDWKDHFATATKKSKPKIKYECPQCGTKCWGKEDLLIKCKPCEVDLLPVN